MSDPYKKVDYARLEQEKLLRIQNLLSLSGWEKIDERNYKYSKLKCRISFSGDCVISFTEEIVLSSDENLATALKRAVRTLHMLGFESTIQTNVNLKYDLEDDILTAYAKVAEE